MADSLTWSDVLTTLLERRDLSVWESTWAMRQIMRGDVTQAPVSYTHLTLPTSDLV